METLNARIKETKLGFIGNDILTFDLILDIQDGGGVIVGGWGMTQYDVGKQKIVGTAYGTSIIMRILQVVGVDTWEELKGKYIRIKDCHLGDRVKAIGNIMNDDWIDFENYKVGD